MSYVSTFTSDVIRAYHLFLSPRIVRGKKKKKRKSYKQTFVPDKLL